MKTEEFWMLLATIFMIALGGVLYSHLKMRLELEETRKQRDEAYELARKAQDSAMYWYDVHEKMVWHYTKPEQP